MSHLFTRLHEGGPVFMYPLLLILILTLILIAKAFLKKGDVEKIIRLIASISLFAIVFGFLGQIVGLIGAFDSLQRTGGNVDPSVFAGGLEISLLVPAFGMSVFLIGRLGIILLIWAQKKENL